MVYIYVLMGLIGMGIDHVDVGSLEDLAVIFIIW